MRVTIGIVGFLGASMTAALAQAPAQRRASLLPPQVADPAETPRVARGAADELPPFPASTPVARNPAGPGWLDGTDSGVRTAGGTGSDPRQVRPLTPPPGTRRDEPSVVTKGIEKFRSAFGSAEAPNAVPPAPAREAANAGSGFRGTANGQPVYAGPPAYRWYGWGSVTPGANPFAPTGQYPRASANWYSITGATPGAFPVPVTDTARLPAGTEPPVYVAMPPVRTAPAAAFAPPSAPPRQPVSATPQNFPPPVPAPITPEPPRFPTTAAQPKSPVATPALTPTPVPTPALPVVPVNTPVTVPTLTPPPAPVAVAPPGPVVPAPAVPPAAPAAVPVLPVTEAEPVSGPRAAGVSLTLSPALPPLPTLPPVPVATAPPAGAVPVGSAHPGADTRPAALVPDVQPAPVTGRAPAALPTSVTEEQPLWQPNTTRPIRNDWAPTGQKQPQPGADPNWRQPGAADTTRTPSVARGQMADDQPDPVVALIKKVCEGRATGVDVRWTGSKKLTVCFECRTAADAQRLVKDVSGRPELAPYQIDFCVVVL